MSRSQIDFFFFLFFFFQLSALSRFSLSNADIWLESIWTLCWAENLMRFSFATHVRYTQFDTIRLVFDLTQKPKRPRRKFKRKSLFMNFKMIPIWFFYLHFPKKFWDHYHIKWVYRWLHIQNVFEKVPSKSSTSFRSIYRLNLFTMRMRMRTKYHKQKHSQKWTRIATKDKTKQIHLNCIVTLSLWTRTNEK